MKVALISYHKNIKTLYPVVLINRHMRSVENQTYKYFDIWEIDYGAGEERIFRSSVYESKSFPTFVHAMNYLIDKLFFKHGYDAIGNLNCDDWYATNRLEIQLPYIEQGYDIVSSNFSLIKNDKEIQRHRFDQLDVRKELNRGHNIIAHPAVIYSKNFWMTNVYRPEEIPFEDLKLWQRAINRDHQMKIVSQCLLFHTIHDNSVCNSENR